jgi:hypothetical protein
MSNKTQFGIVAAHGFSLADRIVANEFDYGDGALQRKRHAIAMNQIARAAEGDFDLKHMWTNNILDDAGKKEALNNLKSKPTKEADDALHDVWDHMDEEHKKTHLENHPDSRFGVIENHRTEVEERHAESEVAEQQQHEEANEELRERHKRRNRNKRVKEKKKGSEDDDDGWWNKLSLTEQKKYLRDHPKSKKARRFRIGIRNLSMKATSGIHREIRAMGHEYKTGMSGLRAMRSGKKMNEEQKEALKKIASRMAKLLLGALAVSAMFTPLAPFALHIGNKYAENMNNRRNELANDHVKRVRRKDGQEIDEDGNIVEPTTVGQTGNNQNGNGSGSPTTVGQVAQAGVNLRGRKKDHEENQKNETELEWMRRDMTEWLSSPDTLHDLHKMVKSEKAKKG